jgi:hypothetical protein
LAGDGIKNKDLFPRPVFDENATVVAIEQFADAGVASKGEALRRYAVGSVEDGVEHDPLVADLEDAQKWRLPVVGAEAADELRVGDEEPPAPADG